MVTSCSRISHNDFRDLICVTYPCEDNPLVQQRTKKVCLHGINLLMPAKHFCFPDFNFVPCYKHEFACSREVKTGNMLAILSLQGTNSLAIITDEIELLPPCHIVAGDEVKARLSRASVVHLPLDPIIVLGMEPARLVKRGLGGNNENIHVEGPCKGIWSSGVDGKVILGLLSNNGILEDQVVAIRIHVLFIQEHICWQMI